VLKWLAITPANTAVISLIEQEYCDQCFKRDGLFNLDVNKNDVIQEAGKLGQNDPTRGKLTVLACIPTKQ